MKRFIVKIKQLQTFEYTVEAINEDEAIDEAVHLHENNFEETEPSPKVEDYGCEVSVQK